MASKVTKCYTVVQFYPSLSCSSSRYLVVTAKMVDDLVDELRGPMGRRPDKPDIYQRKRFDPTYA